MNPRWRRWSRHRKEGRRAQEADLKWMKKQKRRPKVFPKWELFACPFVGIEGMCS
jgi:hypothetical protein